MPLEAVGASETADVAPNSGSLETADRLDWPRHGLSVRNRRVAFAAVQAFLADEDESGRLVPAPDATCERAVRSYDHSIGRSSSDLRRGIAVLAFVLEWLPLFVIGAASRMSRLPLERRIAYLEALESSRIGLLTMLLIAFKVPLCIPAFEEGDELASTGFDRPSTVARRKLPTLPAARVTEEARPAAKKPRVYEAQA